MHRSAAGGRVKLFKMQGLQWLMLADNARAPSEFRPYPASVAYPDGAPPPGPTETLSVRSPDDIGDGGSPHQAPAPGPRETPGARVGDGIGDSGSPDQTPPPEPATAPGDSRGRLARLGDRIAELSARIQAATYELLVLIREFDEREGWDGCVSCAQWLSWRAGLAPGAAREHVRVARALGKLPKLSDAMRRGRISYSKVRAVTRVATPDNEDDLLYVCQAGTAAHVERIARAWRRIDRNAEQAEDRLRDAGRELRTWVDEDGMVVVRGRLTPEVGAALRRALEAACDQARPAPGPEVSADGATPGTAATAIREAANAPAGGLANATTAPEGGATGAAGANAADVEEPTFAQRQADAIGTVAEAALAGGLDRGTAGDRYQVVLHVDAEALPARPDVSAGTSGGAAAKSDGVSAAAVHGSKPRAGDDRVPAGTPGNPTSLSGPRAAARHVPAETPATGRRRVSGPCPGAPSAPAGGSQTVLDEAGGIHVSAETARRLACEAATVTMRHGPGGEILDVGRRTRTISPALRRALAARDQRCRFPGCGNRRVDAHHVRHWADGGRTALDNLVLLCRRHHRAVHEEGFRVTMDATGDARFAHPDGRPLEEAPPAPAWTGPALQPTDDDLAVAGIEIGADTATPSWSGERLDLDWAMHVLWRPRREPAAERAAP